MQDEDEFLDDGGGLLAVKEVGLEDDLHEADPAAVEVDQALLALVVVEALTRVLKGIIKNHY